VTFDPNVCAQSGVCVRSLPAVFDVRRARWIVADAAGADRVAETISRCPSGALQYYRNVESEPSAAYALSKAVALNRIGLALAVEEPRDVRAGGVLEAIRSARDYRWVGLYDVGPEEVVAIAWSGAPPAHPRFPRTRGLTASAVADKKTVVANDAAADARYLETLGSTRAEIIAPVLDHDTGEIVGTIDVASDRAGAFTDRDVDFLEACARAAVALWNS
jgi:putative methionine-R-sulfoxide reductase with GAF domain/uncharacterized Fe-S cluster protein YjdI